MEAVCKRVVILLPIGAIWFIHSRGAKFSFGHFDPKLGDGVID
jgi:hypothetical protein